MKFKHIYILLTLTMALYFVPATAQTKKHQKAKKATAKVVHKKPTKPAKTAKAPAKQPSKTVKPTQSAAQKGVAGSLGDAVAKVTADTTTKAGQAGANLPGTLSEEIIVTTAYKPVLADAVKIRINPDLEDKTPFKAPLSYLPVDKRLGLDTSIKPLVAMKRPAEQDTDLTNNYIKIGVGNLKTTYGEAYFNNGKDPALQVGAYLKHFMQSGSLTKQNSAKEEVGVFGKSVGRSKLNKRGRLILITGAIIFTVIIPIPCLRQTCKLPNNISALSAPKLNWPKIIKMLKTILPMHLN